MATRVFMIKYPVYFKIGKSGIKCSEFVILFTNDANFPPLVFLSHVNSFSHFGKNDRWRDSFSYFRCITSLSSAVFFSFWDEVQSVIAETWLPLSRVFLFCFYHNLVSAFEFFSALCECVLLKFSQRSIHAG